MLACVKLDAGLLVKFVKFSESLIPAPMGLPKLFFFYVHSVNEHFLIRSGMKEAL